MDVPALLPDAGYRHVSVPVDGSQLPSAALPTARALAARFGETVHAVAVAQSDDEVDGLRPAAARALSSDCPGDRILVEVDHDVAGVVAERLCVTASRPHHHRLLRCRTRRAVPPPPRLPRPSVDG